MQSTKKLFNPKAVAPTVSTKMSAPKQSRTLFNKLNSGWKAAQQTSQEIKYQSRREFYRRCKPICSNSKANCNWVEVWHGGRLGDWQSDIARGGMVSPKGRLYIGIAPNVPEEYAMSATLLAQKTLPSDPDAKEFDGPTPLTRDNGVLLKLRVKSEVPITTDDAFGSVYLADFEEGDVIIEKAYEVTPEACQAPPDSVGVMARWQQSGKAALEAMKD